MNQLRPNYPNPFNPETWIPYSLTKDTQVSIFIYDAMGRLIRTLNLGHRQSGVYVTQEKAAHWDGRNDAGESVASGVYLYRIEAGDFVQTRKMMLLK